MLQAEEASHHQADEEGIRFDPCRAGQCASARTQVGVFMFRVEVFSCTKSIPIQHLVLSRPCGGSNDRSLGLEEMHIGTRGWSEVLKALSKKKSGKTIFHQLAHLTLSQTNLEQVSSHVMLGAFAFKVRCHENRLCTLVDFCQRFLKNGSSFRAQRTALTCSTR